MSSVSEQLDLARARLDARVDLLGQSLNLREQLSMGILDLDDARAAVWKFKRAIRAEQRRQ
jgi:hypothetical protein